MSLPVWAATERAAATACPSSLRRRLTSFVLIAGRFPWQRLPLRSLMKYVAEPTRFAALAPIPEVNFDRIDEVSMYERLEQKSRSLLVDFDPLRDVPYMNWRCSSSKAQKRDHNCKLVNEVFSLRWCKRALTCSFNHFQLRSQFQDGLGRSACPVLRSSKPPYKSASASIPDHPAACIRRLPASQLLHTAQRPTVGWHR